MAEEVQIQGSQEIGKIRNPLGVIGLILVTLGIYGIVWYYKVNKEMAALGQARGTEDCGTDPGKSLLAIIPGFLIIVPPILSWYNAWKRLQSSERVSGAPEGMEPGLGFVLTMLISPVGYYIFQSNLNKVLQAQSGGAPAQAPAAAQA